MDAERDAVLAPRPPESVDRGEMAQEATAVINGDRVAVEQGVSYLADDQHFQRDQLPESQPPELAFVVSGGAWLTMPPP